MAMVVTHNLAAYNTLNQLTTNNKNVSKSLKKISSGLKISSAGDGASEYAISERMRSQIRSLGQANINAENGSSLLKTAEGAVSSTVDILKTMKEKALNAANDTNTERDRATIQQEFNQYIDQIDDNSGVTFNSMTLIDGSKRSKGIATTSIFLNYKLNPSTTYNDQMTSLKDRDGNSLGIAATDNAVVTYTSEGKTYSETLKGLGHYLLTACGGFSTTESDDGQLHSGLVNFTNTVNGYVPTAVATDRYGTAIGNGSDAVVLVARYKSTNTQIAGYTIHITDAAGNDRNYANSVLNSFQEAVTAEDSSEDHSISLQVGTKSNQSIHISLSDMSSAGLGLSGRLGKLQLITKKQANAAIDVLDRSLQKALSQQTGIGAVESRLQYTSKNLTLESENVTAASSVICDADMAKEMTAYTKNNVLLQASQSMLAQANQNSSSVLSLLKE